MSKKPSDATLLRRAKATIRDLQRQLAETKTELTRYRGRATQAEIAATDWRKRFDLLLAREPEYVRSIPTGVSDSKTLGPSDT